MVWIVVLLCLLLVGFLPLGIRAWYKHGKGSVILMIGPLRLSVYPQKQRRSQKNGVKKDGFESHAQAAKKRRSFMDYFPIVQLICDFLKDFRTKLRINDLRFKAILAEDDPCDLSVHYGQAWAAVGNVMPLLENSFTIKKRNIEIECDYIAESTQIYAYVDMRITVAQMLSIGIFHGYKILRKYFEIKKNAKDGATL